MPIDVNGMRSFDVEGKGREWHTAFYYLAEHIRLLSRGSVNHKELYSLVGTEGRYINHANPVVRKRTAGALSRIVHTRRYVQDMKTCYTQDNTTFLHAATEVCAAIRETCPCDAHELARYLREACWPDVRRGLANEHAEWRGGIDLFKVDREANVLFEDRSQTLECADDEFFLVALFHLIAFGGMELPLSRQLVDEYPTGRLDVGGGDASVSVSACLVKFADVQRSSIVGTWPLTADRPFTIGRYLDCGIIEADRGISRMHACVYHKGEAWYFEDLGSRNGSCVARSDGNIVFDSTLDGARTPFELACGDYVILAGRFHYWFGALQDAAAVR